MKDTIKNFDKRNITQLPKTSLFDSSKNKKALPDQFYVSLDYALN